MADTPKPEPAVEPVQSKHERVYSVVCLVSLLLVVVIMMLDGLGVWSVLPMLVGGVAFLLRWRSGPPMVLFTFLWMAPTHFLNYHDESTTFLASIVRVDSYQAHHLDRFVRLDDVILCVALLTYTATCYRALALSYSIFPPEYRRFRGLNREARKRPPASRSNQLLPRPGEPTDPRELPLLFGALAASAVMGCLLWLLSRFVPAAWDLSGTVVRNAASFWLCMLVVSLSLALFRYLGRRRAPTAENLLYLQDEVWRQTRQEQMVVNRWLVWARLRGQRRKEP